MQGHDVKFDANHRMLLPSSRALLYTTHEEFDGKDVWWLVFEKDAVIRAVESTEDLIDRFNNLISEEYSDWQDEFSLTQDELGTLLVTCAVQFYEKQPFKVFMKYLAEVEAMTYEVAAKLQL